MAIDAVDSDPTRPPDQDLATLPRHPPRRRRWGYRIGITYGHTDGKGVLCVGCYWNRWVADCERWRKLFGHWRSISAHEAESMSYLCNDCGGYV